MRSRVPFDLHGKKGVAGCRRFMEQAAGQTAARSGALMNEHGALARRLGGREDDHLRFTTGFRAPPDGNGSERDMRMVRLRQKVSGCLRTFTGARQLCAICGYPPTVSRHGLGVFGAVVMLTADRPWMPVAA